MAKPVPVDPPPDAIPVACPFCKAVRTLRLSECFDASGVPICELWFCRNCRAFFPEKIVVAPPLDVVEDPGGADRRRHRRLDVQFVIEVLSVGVNRRPILATVTNASGGGFCFLFAEAIPEGTEVKFRISLPSVPKSFDAKGRIVRCLPAPDGSFGLAVNFTEVDPQYKVAVERYVRQQVGPPGAEESR